MGSGVDDDGVEEGLAELAGEPVQVGGVLVVDGGVELDLDGEDLAVVADKDQVDLVVAVAGAQVADGGVGCLGGDADAQCDQRLEEVAERGAGLGAEGLAFAVQEGGEVRAEEPGGQGGVGEVVLGCLPESGQGVPGGRPCGHGVEQPQLGQDVSVGDARAAGGLVGLAGRGGVEQARVARGRGCGRGVRPEPGEHRLGLAHGQALFGHVAVDGVVQVGVELEPQCPRAQAAQSREPGGQDLLGVVGQP